MNCNKFVTEAKLKKDQHLKSYKPLCVIQSKNSNVSARSTSIVRNCKEKGEANKENIDLSINDSFFGMNASFVSKGIAVSNSNDMQEDNSQKENYDWIDNILYSGHSTKSDDSILSPLNTKDNKNKTPKRNCDSNVDLQNKKFKPSPLKVHEENLDPFDDDDDKIFDSIDIIKSLGSGTTVVDVKNKKTERDCFKSYLEKSCAIKNDNSKSKEATKSDKSLVKINSATVSSTVLTPAASYTSMECTNETKTALFCDRYRKEIETTFKKLEYSIHEMGVQEEDAFLHDITLKNCSLVINDTLNQTDFAVASIPVKDTSVMSSTLKNALLENGARPTEIHTVVNATITECTPSLAETGPFYGLPETVQQLLKHYRGITDLYDWQKECLNLPSVHSRKNLIYALPTSGGKTLVAEILMFRELLCRKKNVIFVLPFVAIVQEKVWALSPFAVTLNFLVEEYASVKGTYPPRKRRRKNSIYVATIEKALGLVNSLYEKGRINELGLVVVDELHLIGEQGRGTTLEALLTKLMHINSNIHIVGMSATIGNLDEICTFLKAEKYVRNFRPVELIEYVKCGNEIAKINRNVQDESELFTVVRNADFSYSEAYSKIDKDRIGALVMEVVPSGSCLIFCSSKKNCENLALNLCRTLFRCLLDYKKPEKEHLMESLKNDCGSLCDVLKNSIPFGVAYHHSGLTNEERRLIEDGFRAGILSVICCTSTLAAGVNLPAKRVILRQPYIGRNFINLSRYKQMVGRAGRAGLGEIGESILICEYLDLPKVKQMLMSPMDQAVSNMHANGGAGLRHLLLSCISLGIANTRVKLQEIVSKTLMAVQQEFLGVNYKKITDRCIGELFKLSVIKLPQKSDKSVDYSVSSASDVSFQFKSPFDSSGEMQLTQATSIVSSDKSLESTPLENKDPLTLKHNSNEVTKIAVFKDSIFEVSRLGSAAIKGRLELDKAHLLYTDLKEAQKMLILINALHLIYLVTPYDLTDQIKPDGRIYYSLYTKLDDKHLKTANVLGIDESCAYKIFTGKLIKIPCGRVINRFYLALMLHDLWNEHGVIEVSEKYQVDRGMVQNLLSQAATFAINVVNFCEELEEFWPFVHLLKGLSQKLSNCCIRDILPLMELPAVKESRAKQLYNAGYKTLQSVANADPNKLVETIDFMSKRVANQLIAAAKMLLLEKVENLREEAEDVMDGIESPKNFFMEHLTQLGNINTIS